MQQVAVAPRDVRATSALRHRSRSGSPRRWPGEAPAPRTSWREARFGTDVMGGDLKVEQPARLSEGPRPTELPYAMTGEDQLDPLMTFRTFVIDRVGEEDTGEKAVTAYAQYLELFRQGFRTKLLRRFQSLPCLSERYGPEDMQRVNEEIRRVARLQASQFLKLMAEERLVELALVEPRSKPHSVASTARPFCLLMGQTMASPALQRLYCIPEDPDVNSLCLRNVPSHISRWDVLEHLKAVEALDGLLELALTTAPDAELSMNADVELSRTAWLKYSSEESCATAEEKLEGTTLLRYSCRPVRRVPNVDEYSLRVTPSEACHPARILRDLHISARLILKLDAAFAVHEALGLSEGLPIEPSETSYQRHPILADLPAVLLGHGKAPQAQLDLQLQYLRIVHRVCYYSGRRFPTYRELWNATGPLYVRPSVCREDLLTLPGFGPLEVWDFEYTSATDVAAMLQEPPVWDYTPLEDPRLFITTGEPFEPKTAVPHDTKDEAPRDSEAVSGIIKFEDDMAMVDAVKEEAPTKTESAEITGESRGRGSRWLEVLDARLLRLLQEELDIPTIDETNEEVVIRWREVCDTSMAEVEPEKWRCTLCRKLFRGAEFVRKHLKNKHADQLKPIISQVREQRFDALHRSDPFRLPVRLPKPTPYLYRTAYLKHRRQHESPQLLAAPGAPHPPLRPLPAPAFSPFLTGMAGGRLSENGGRKEYRDLDAPPRSASLGGNLRASIQYDDL